MVPDAEVITAPHQYTLSTHTTLLTHPTNTTYQPTLSTHPINTPYNTTY